MSATTLEIKATRYKGGTWSVAIRYPDGSTETRRGLVDELAANVAIWHAIKKVEGLSGDSA